MVVMPRRGLKWAAGFGASKVIAELREDGQKSECR